MIMPGEGCFIAIILRSDPVKTKKTFIRTCYCLVKVKLITAERPPGAHRPENFVD